MADEDEEIGIYETSASTDARYSADFDDDGEVAYGYMKIDGKITADVWLYNRGETPVVWPWRNGPEGLPFRNPEAFVGPHRFEPANGPDEIAFKWLYGNDGIPVAVEFWIRGKFHARATPDSKPGWCVLAIKDGPLARKLD